ncbi:MAG: hypothetical protein J6Y32_03050 [Bacteroidales bacterium]|nr:hypothetical protein [Bacteroidales bacterium]
MKRNSYIPPQCRSFRLILDQPIMELSNLVPSSSSFEMAGWDTGDELDF